MLRFKRAINIFLRNDEIDLRNGDVEIEMTNNEWEQLEEFEKFLRKFKQESSYMESESYPTIPCLVPMFNILIDHVEDWQTKKQKGNTIYNAAVAAREKLVKYYSRSNVLMSLIAILDPRLNLQYLFNDHMPKKHIDEVKRKLKQLKSDYMELNRLQMKNVNENNMKSNEDGQSIIDLIFDKRKKNLQKMN